MDVLTNFIFADIHIWVILLSVLFHLFHDLIFGVPTRGKVTAISHTFELLSHCSPPQAGICSKKAYGSNDSAFLFMAYSRCDPVPIETPLDSSPRESGGRSTSYATRSAFREKHEDSEPSMEDAQRPMIRETVVE